MLPGQWTTRVDSHAAKIMKAVMLNEAKTSGRGQSYEAETNFWSLRPRPRPKIIMKKVPNND